MTQFIMGDEEGVEDDPGIMLLTNTHFYGPSAVLNASPVFVLHNTTVSFIDERTEVSKLLVSAKNRKSDSRICS